MCMGARTTFVHIELAEEDGFDHDETVPFSECPVGFTYSRSTWGLNLITSVGSGRT